MGGISTKPVKYSVLSHAIEILEEAKLQDMAEQLSHLGNLFLTKGAKEIASAIVNLHGVSSTLITRDNILLFHMPDYLKAEWKLDQPLPHEKIDQITRLLKELGPEFANQATFDYFYMKSHMTRLLSSLLKLKLLNADNFRYLDQHPQHVIEITSSLYYAVMLSQGLRNNSSPIFRLNRDLVAKIAAFSSAYAGTQKEIAPFICTAPRSSSNKQQSISTLEETKSQVPPETSSLSLGLAYLTRSGVLSSSSSASASQNPAQSGEEDVATNQNTNQATNLIFRQRVRGG